MHKRGFDGKSTPIGRVENIYVENDELCGTPVFDMKDSFATEIGCNWEENFIHLCTAGVKPIKLSSASEHFLPGQTWAMVIERHKEAISEKKYSRKIHEIAPNENTKATPVIFTTGDVSEGRKVMIRKDMVRLKKLFDKNKVPKARRCLVLCSDHIADLLENDQKFVNRYHNYASGKVSKLYASESKNNPTTQENLISFHTYLICLLLKNEAMDAIVSTKA